MSRVYPFPVGGKDLLGEFPIKLTEQAARQLIGDLMDYPETQAQLERALRIGTDGHCTIGLSLDLEITKLTSSQ